MSDIKRKYKFIGAIIAMTALLVVTFTMLGIFLSGNVSNISRPYEENSIWRNFANPDGVTGDGTEEDPLVLYSAENCAWWACEIERGSLSGMYVTLGANIDLSGHMWGPVYISSGCELFFNGNNYTISNMIMIDYYTPNAGFLGICEGIFDVRNLNFSNVCFISTGYSYDAVGVLCGMINSLDYECNIENVTVQSGMIKLFGEESSIIGALGGLIGKVANTRTHITNCSNNADIYCEQRGIIGGLIGEYVGTDVIFSGEIVNCSNSGSVTVRNYDCRIGGIFGRTDLNCYSIISNILNTGDVSLEYTFDDESTSEYYYGLVGGIFGHVGSSGNGVELAGITNKGDISGVGIKGGIAGFAEFAGSIELEENYKFSNLVNWGDVSGTKTVGGVFGVVYNSKIKNCFNKGNLTGDTFVGGIIAGHEGSLTGPVYMSNCYSEGVLTGRRCVGGLAGNLYVIPEGAIQNCGFNGTIVVRSMEETSSAIMTKKVGTFIGSCMRENNEDHYEENVSPGAIINCFGIANVIIECDKNIMRPDYHEVLNEYLVDKDSSGIELLVGHSYSFMRIFVDNGKILDSERRCLFNGSGGDWSEMAYDSSLNGGWPFPRSMFAVGEFIECGDVYEYLSNYGFVDCA